MQVPPGSVVLSRCPLWIGFPKHSNKLLLM